MVDCGRKEVRILQAVDVHPDIEWQLSECACNRESEVLAVPVVRHHHVEAADV